MKKEIHPKYYPETKVKCACGNSFTVGSSVPEINIEICSKCHPFYTGKDKIIDTAGRVERFKKRLKKASDKNKAPVKSKAPVKIKALDKGKKWTKLKK